VFIVKINAGKEPNFKIIANFLLHRIKPLRNTSCLSILLNILGSSRRYWYKTLRHLSDGKPLGMFPGEVSSYRDGKLMVDKPWEEGAIKVIRKAQACYSHLFSC
jgi:hypothetical protein